MHVWQWLLTGLIAGLLGRWVLPESRIGFAGDLALGSIGGIATGTLLRMTGIIEPRPGTMQMAVALTGAIGMLALMHLAARAALRATRVVGNVVQPRNLQARIAQLSPTDRAVLDKFLAREPVAHDLEQEHITPLGERLADGVARFGGSWAFIGLFGAVLSAWMLYNHETVQPFDPYPFILLNLVLSCLAAIQAPIILMSQNRAAQKDREHAHADYEINLKAELEILALHEKVDELRERAWRELITQQERQIELLERLLGQRETPR